MTPTTTDRMVNLSDVLAIIDGYMTAPDGCYYAHQFEMISGWETAAARIRAKVEELGNDE